MNNTTELVNIKPKNMQLADAVREEINSGRLKSGERILSDSELARKYKINERTVAAGLNILVREGLLERIPRCGTFVSKKTKDILLPPVLLLHEVRSQVLNSGHPFYMSLFNTLNSCANQNGMSFQTFDTSIDEKPTTTLLKNINTHLCSTLKSGAFSGFFLFGGNYNTLMDEVKILNKPYVLVYDGKINLLSAPSNLVGIDYSFTETTALNYFAEKKCNKVGIITPFTNLHIPNIIELGRCLGIQIRYFRDNIDKAFAWSDGIFVEDDYFVLSNIIKFTNFPEDRLICMKNAGLDIPLNCMKFEVNGVELAKVAWSILEKQLKEGNSSNAVLIKPQILKRI